jgi:hypothetical protein
VGLATWKAFRIKAKDKRTRTKGWRKEVKGAKWDFDKCPNIAEKIIGPFI